MKMKKVTIKITGPREAVLKTAKDCEKKYEFCLNPNYVIEHRNDENVHCYLFLSPFVEKK